MTSEDTASENLSIRQIFRLIAGGWRTVLALTVIGVLIAVFIQLTSTRQYRSYYDVMPTPVSDDPTRANMGISLDVLGRQSKTPDWEMYQSLLTSTTLAQRLIDKTSLLQELFSGDWDPVKREWRTDVDFWSAPLIGKVSWLMGNRKKRAPDKFALQAYLRKNVSISVIPDTTQVRVSIDSPDPKTSLQLLFALHQTANDMVREVHLTRALGQRANLLEELKTTQISDYRQTLLAILSRVETNVMTASIKGQYAGLLVDGPVSGPFPVFPVLKLLLELAVAAGAVGGLILIVFFQISDAMLFDEGRGRRHLGKIWTGGRSAKRLAERP